MSHAAQMKRMGRACSAPCRFIVWAIRRSRTHEMEREARNRGRHGGQHVKRAIRRSRTHEMEREARNRGRHGGQHANRGIL